MMIMMIIIINSVSIPVDKITLKQISVFLSLYHSTNDPYSYFIQLSPMLYNLRDNIVGQNSLLQSLEKHNTLCEHCRRTTLYHEVRLLIQFKQTIIHVWRKSNRGVV